MANTFSDEMKEIEELNKSSIKSIYYINNLLRDCYIKLERCRLNNVSSTTFDYFYGKLVDMSRFRNDRIYEFQLDKMRVVSIYNECLNDFKNQFFIEYKKEYPNSKCLNVNDLLFITRDVLVLDKNLENQLLEVFTRINNGEDVSLSPLEQSYMMLANFVMQVAPNMECHDIMEGIFKMVDETGRALYKDDCLAKNISMPDAFQIDDKTYAISISKLNNFKILSNLLVRKFEKYYSDADRKVKILESKIKTCKNDDKVAMYHQRLSDELLKRETFQSHIVDSKSITSELEHILERKAGLNSMVSPQITNFDVMLSTLSSKINNGINNLWLRMTTEDNISEIVDYIDYKNEHLVVHTNEVDAIIDAGKNLFTTLISTIELASLTDKYIYIPIEQTEYSAQVVRFINEENDILIEERLQEKAKAEKISVEELKTTLTTSELQNFGYDKEMLKHIVFQTPNGNFVYDGENIINAVTDEIIKLDSLDLIDELFGISEVQDEVEGIIKTIENRLNISDDGGME